MVMGSSRLQPRSASSHFGSLRLSTLLYCIMIFVILSSVVSLASSCNPDACVRSYNRANRRINRSKAKLSQEEFRNKQCRALRTFKRCIRKMPSSCRGNLLFHSIEKMNDGKFEKYNCSPHNRHRSPKPAPVTIKPDPETPTDNATTLSTSTFPDFDEATEGGECTFAGKPVYKHCGMFGDPHLRTFADNFYTCNVERTWPLIDNDYMVVMVTNVPVKEESSATITTKITVLIKSAGKCTGGGKLVYTASSHDGLTGAFNDGSTTSGSVAIFELVPKRHVEIRARFIGTTVIIRQVGRYLTFAIRMPEEYLHGLDSHSQLCVDGCPRQHQISSEKHIEKLRKNHDKTKSNPADRPTKATSKDTHDNEKNARSPLVLHDPTPANAEKTNPNKMYFTEEEARVKCKKIILAATEAQQQKTSELERKPNDDDDGGRNSRLSNSLSSSAFSSLTPSGVRSRRRKHRKRAATRPQASLSFKQLHSSAPDPSDAQRIPTSTGRRGRKRKSKRQTQESSSNSEKSNFNLTPCRVLPKDKSRMFNFYFDSCVFDLVTTGDVNFTLAASAALQDVMRTHPQRDEAPGASLEVIRLWEPLEPDAFSGCEPTVTGTEDKSGDGAGGGASKPGLMLTFYLCVALSCVYVNCIAWLLNDSSRNSSKQFSQTKKTCAVHAIYNDLSSRTKDFNVALAAT
ncbi:unnamed protein product [Clavelina lepadiformis]|uniref:Repulsive guidance molecule A n=1 Tax=Clavelina lepadiformis TaxID=159417 RepID=A0ABP0GRS1_CLALP